MKKSKKITLIVLGTIGLSILTIVAIILYYYISLSIGFGSKYIGNAPEEDIVMFEKYYEDFEKVNDFIIGDYDKYRKAREDQYYSFDTKNGKIKVSIYSDANDELLEINDDLKKSVKRLSDYEENLRGAHVKENRVDYHIGSLLVYTRDGLVPTYMSKPDESNSVFGIYKLRNNWYHIFVP